MNLSIQVLAKNVKKHNLSQIGKVYRVTSDNNSLKTSLILGWLLTLALTVLIMLGPIYVQNLLDFQIVSFFHSFSHGIFAFILSWIIFATLTNYGGKFHLGIINFCWDSLRNFSGNVRNNEIVLRNISLYCTYHQIWFIHMK